MEFDKKRTILYLVWAFGLGWAVQIAASVFALNGSAGAARLLLVIAMFAPIAAALLSGFGLGGMGWAPRLRGRLGFLAAAWLLPAVLTAVGAALYFIIFPAHLDLTGAALGEENMAQLSAQGLDFGTYLIIGSVQSVTIIPVLNAFAAIGEEAGWRGVLYPQLKARFGRRLGLVLGGLIWGAWHWPMIALTGYEYGTGYPGFPVLGMLLFPVICVAIGALCDWVYEKTGCIWVPAVAHGAINAAGGIPALMGGAGSITLLGPAPVGLIGGAGFIALAAYIIMKGERNDGLR